jgi:hypothetical protein
MARANKSRKQKVRQRKNLRPVTKQLEVSSLDEFRKRYLPAEIQEKSHEQLTSHQIGEEFARQSLAKVRAMLTN